MSNGADMRSCKNHKYEAESGCCGKHSNGSEAGCCGNHKHEGDSGCNNTAAESCTHCGHGAEKTAKNNEWTSTNLK